MAEKFLMPKLSPTMEEGQIARWVKNEGDTYEANETLAEVDTDKATMEMTALTGGTLLKILKGEGETAALGCDLLQNGFDAGRFLLRPGGAVDGLGNLSDGRIAQFLPRWEAALQLVERLPRNRVGGAVGEKDFYQGGDGVEEGPVRLAVFLAQEPQDGAGLGFQWVGGNLFGSECHLLLHFGMRGWVIGGGPLLASLGIYIRHGNKFSR